MQAKRQAIILLFSSIFFLKVAFCVGTLYFSCDNQKLMNSLIMQLEIEHDETSSEETKELLSKEFKFTQSKNLNELNNKQLNSAIQAYLLFTNHYPLDVHYTTEEIQPPELLS
jgi:hypothetical protein